MTKDPVLRDMAEGFACPHLTIVNGVATCKIYANRPPFCKDFPAEPADLCSSDCGFVFVKKDQLAQAELL